MRSQPLPMIHAEVFRTQKGTPYLKDPGVVVLSCMHTDLSGVQGFLDGFDSDLGFGDYLKDPTALKDGDQLAKFGGQLCYMSFSPERSYNKDAGRYFENIKSSGHGSVLEHVYISMLFYGIDRAVTHELVRHRAGFGFSQVSQRYVNGKVLRFVEDSTFQVDKRLHAKFESRIDRVAAEYDYIAERLAKLQASKKYKLLSGAAKRDLRKKMNQSARRALTNEAEAPILVTANVRGWRHFTEMRATEHADVAIRKLGVSAMTCLKGVEDYMFDDFLLAKAEDGTDVYRNRFKKV